MSFFFQQLPLALQLRDDATFDNFYPADNALLVNQLRYQLDGGERYQYIYGQQGCGRSHLLQAACHQANQVHKAAVFLPLKELHGYPPDDLFEGLEQLSLVCLDDVDSVVAKPEWQLPLFNLFNRLLDNNCCLLISANAPVRELPCGLADLTSRLSWGSIYQIKNLSDQQKISALQFRARRRGLKLSDEVVQFIFHRCQRDTKTLMAVLDNLDKASLTEQRRLTVPFVKMVMEW